MRLVQKDFGHRRVIHYLGILMLNVHRERAFSQREGESQYICMLPEIHCRKWNLRNYCLMCTLYCDVIPNFALKYILSNIYKIYE